MLLQAIVKNLNFVTLLDGEKGIPCSTYLKCTEGAVSGRKDMSVDGY